MSENPKYQPTLCWDCAKAIGGCRWSADLKPVKGWKIIPTKREAYGGIFRSCIVLECPEFKRDAINGGLKKYKENEDVTVREDTGIYETFWKNLTR